MASAAASRAPPRGAASQSRAPELELLLLEGVHLARCLPRSRGQLRVTLLPARELSRLSAPFAAARAEPRVVFDTRMSFPLRGAEAGAKLEFDLLDAASSAPCARARVPLQQLVSTPPGTICSVELLLVAENAPAAVGSDAQSLPHSPTRLRGAQPRLRLLVLSGPSVPRAQSVTIAPWSSASPPREGSRARPPPAPRPASAATAVPAPAPAPSGPPPWSPTKLPPQPLPQQGPAPPLPQQAAEAAPPPQSPRPAEASVRPFSGPFKGPPCPSAHAPGSPPRGLSPEFPVRSVELTIAEARGLSASSLASVAASFANQQETTTEQPGRNPAWHETCSFCVLPGRSLAGQLLGLTLLDNGVPVGSCDVELGHLAAAGGRREIWVAVDAARRSRLLPAASVAAPRQGGSPPGLSVQTSVSPESSAWLLFALEFLRAPVALVASGAVASEWRAPSPASPARRRGDGSPAPQPGGPPSPRSAASAEPLADGGPGAQQWLANSPAAGRSAAAALVSQLGCRLSPCRTDAEDRSPLMTRSELLLRAGRHAAGLPGRRSPHSWNAATPLPLPVSAMEARGRAGRTAPAPPTSVLADWLRAHGIAGPAQSEVLSALASVGVSDLTTLKLFGEADLEACGLPLGLRRRISRALGLS
eukprot:TRINITY_DN10372_c3_g1_i2.p1 TRINITY_DN10372_c3_g1~~TRINITY_DN10372_c3_g1_i2.p1  ORF type:complete len:668 (+),score=114.61 TRINITY_DN10372_c3_g1_i2:66-2006(+)